MSPHFASLLNFTRGIVDTFKVGPADVRIGIVEFNTWYKTVIPLIEGDSRTAILSAIDNKLEAPTGKTATSYGLSGAKDMLEVTKARADTIQRTVLVLTDGVQSVFGTDSNAIAKAQELKDLGYTVLSVGFPKAVEATITSMASEPPSQNAYYGTSVEDIASHYQQEGLLCKLTGLSVFASPSPPPSASPSPPPSAAPSPPLPSASPSPPLPSASPSPPPPSASPTPPPSASPSPPPSASPSPPPGACAEDALIAIQSCKASSTFSGKYGCERAYDGEQTPKGGGVDKKKAWATKGQGVGSWIELNFEASAINALRYANRDGTRNSGKNEKLLLTFTTASGVVTQKVTLVNPYKVADDWQTRYDFPEVAGATKVRISVESTYGDESANNGAEEIGLYYVSECSSPSPSPPPSASPSPPQPSASPSPPPSVSPSPPAPSASPSPPPSSCGRDNVVDIQGCAASSEHGGKFRCDNVYDGERVDFRGVTTDKKIAWATKGEGVGSWIDLRFGSSAINALRYANRDGPADAGHNEELLLNFTTPNGYVTREVTLTKPSRATDDWTILYDFEEVTGATEVRISVVSVFTISNNGAEEIALIHNVPCVPSPSASPVPPPSVSPSPPPPSASPSPPPSASPTPPPPSASPSPPPPSASPSPPPSASPSPPPPSASPSPPPCVEGLTEVAIQSCTSSTEFSGKYGCKYAYDGETVEFGDKNGDKKKAWATKGEGVGSWIELAFASSSINVMKYANRDAFKTSGHNKELLLNFTTPNGYETREVTLNKPTKEVDDWTYEYELDQVVGATKLRIEVVSVFDVAKTNNGAEEIFLGQQTKCPEKIRIKSFFKSKNSK